MTFFSKLKWVLGILIVFLLIITTNLIDRNNFVRVKESVETIYEDRLVAKDLIYEMMNSIHKKEIALVKKDSNFYKIENSKIDAKIDNLILKFENTKLTNSESGIFDNLKNNLNALFEVEKKLKDSNYTYNSKALSQIQRVKQDLDDLSEIQLDEGSRQLSISKRAIDNVELFTQLEIYVLIIMAIAIQIIIIYKPKNEK